MIHFWEGAQEVYHDDLSVDSRDMTDSMQELVNTSTNLQHTTTPCGAFINYRTAVAGTSS